MSIWDKLKLAKNAADVVVGGKDLERERAESKRAEADKQHAENMGAALGIIREQSGPVRRANVVSPSETQAVEDVVTTDESLGIAGLIETEIHEQTPGGGKDQWRRTEVRQEGTRLRVTGSEDTITQDADGNRRMSRTRYDLHVPIEQAQSVLSPLIEGQSPVSLPAISPPDAPERLLHEIVESRPTENQLRLVESDGSESVTREPGNGKDRLV